MNALENIVMMNLLRLHHVNSILWEISFVKVHAAEATNLVQSLTVHDAFKIWHRQIDHLNVNDVHILQNMVSAIKLGMFSCITSSLLCEAWTEGKQYRVAFSNEGGGGGKQPRL